MTRPPRSLRRQLLAGVLGAVAVLWLAAAALTWWDARHELDELLDAHLSQAAALLVAQEGRALDGHAPRHPGDDEDDGEDAPLEIAALHRYARHVAFQVWHEGRLVLRSPNAPATPLSDRRSGFETRTVNGDTWRLFATRGEDRDVQVYVAEQQAGRQDILRAVLRGLAGPLLLALPLIALALWWAVDRALRPLGRLGETLAARPPGDLRPVAPAEPLPAELQPLVQALDGLLARIATLLDSERRFTADAAHELRTPIAAIRTQAQVALAAQADAERRHALQATLQGCDRAAHLVQQLLTLSRLEGGGALPPQALDLAALARSVVAEQAPAAIARGQQLELEAPAHWPARGDEALLRVLLRNLVDNALRYSPPGAQVQVRLAPLPQGGAVLRVDDSGPGLAPADLARLGERFFRPPGQTAPGSGLGWSIVRRIAAVHGAELRADSPGPLGGLGVALHWPPDGLPYS